jgi:mannose-6-phosphate isomerase-like protein (cupin superfamily)
MPIQPIIIEKAINCAKGWGREVQIANNRVLKDEQFPTGYSGKLLVYDTKNAKSSMHFHTVKHETFYVLKGAFTFWHYDPVTADLFTNELTEGDVVVIPPNNPHQLMCRTEGATIIEFASTDNCWDNFRIMKGDSQTKNINFPHGGVRKDTDPAHHNED